MSDAITTYEEVVVPFAELGSHLHEYMVMVDSVHNSQYVIDLIEYLQDELIGLLERGDDPKQKFFNLNAHMGATCYHLENILEIMDKSLHDVDVVKGILEQYRKYDDIKYVGLL